jgi:hypothetical protein
MSSLISKYVLDPVQIRTTLFLALAVGGRKGEHGRSMVRHIRIGEICVLEGVVAFNEEVHVHVGVVIKRLVALEAYVI